MIWYFIAAWAVRNFDRLRARAERTPYSHITSPDGTSVYMYRYWLFNPYRSESGARVGEEASRARWSWLPSIRLHHIMRPDNDRHMHDHPWNARTIVLRGWYEEQRYTREWENAEYRELWAQGADARPFDIDVESMTRGTLRLPGYTGRLLYGQFHRISHVSQGGVWTLFFTWKERGIWGFDVKGVKVPWRTYLAERDAE